MLVSFAGFSSAALFQPNCFDAAETCETLKRLKLSQDSPRHCARVNRRLLQRFPCARLVVLACSVSVEITNKTTQRRRINICDSIKRASSAHRIGQDDIAKHLRRSLARESAKSKLNKHQNIDEANCVVHRMFALFASRCTQAPENHKLCIKLENDAGPCHRIHNTKAAPCVGRCSESNVILADAKQSTQNVNCRCVCEGPEKSRKIVFREARPVCGQLKCKCTQSQAGQSIFRPPRKGLEINDAGASKEANKLIKHRRE
jgi:hypothetical protein